MVTLKIIPAQTISVFGTRPHSLLTMFPAGDQYPKSKSERDLFITISLKAPTLLNLIPTTTPVSLKIYSISPKVDINSHSIGLLDGIDLSRITSSAFTLEDWKLAPSPPVITIFILMSHTSNFLMDAPTLNLDFVAKEKAPVMELSLQILNFKERDNAFTLPNIHQNQKNQKFI